MIPKERGIAKVLLRKSTSGHGAVFRGASQMLGQAEAQGLWFTMPSLLASTLGKSLPLSEPQFIYPYNKEVMFYQYILSNKFVCRTLIYETDKV